ELPLQGKAQVAVSHFSLQYRLRGQESWTHATPNVENSNRVLLVRAFVPNAHWWSPEHPDLYELLVSLGDSPADTLQLRAAFRSIETSGSELRLNGHALQIRGVLNWGYSPPQVEPNPGEAVWREELEFARSYGFNLMKFCLWVPPQRYLELADEMGVLAWMEYPTWHPDFSEKFLEPLQREFGEFFRYDRNHPAVVLRSLTCETGPSADLKVIQALFNSAHQVIPGAVVEDDSSWIEWNRVCDFYDDHPYGNNRTWVPTLQRLNDYVLAHGVKPLVLGEAIAADTWLDRDQLVKHFGNERPWYAPGVLDSSALWTQQVQRVIGQTGLVNLRPDSLRYGLLMRKYQAETFRREVPHGGYVISTLRDIPNASMGLLDYLGRPKWPKEQWAWQRDTVCLLKTEDDCRSFSSADRITGEIFLSHFGPEPIVDGRLRISLQSPEGSTASSPSQELTQVHQGKGVLSKLMSFDLKSPEVKTPTPMIISAELESPIGRFRNEWPIWIIPKLSAHALQSVLLHSSVTPRLRQELFEKCDSFGSDPLATNRIVVASRFDDRLAQFLEAGGRVLFLPDGEKNSLPLNAQWFLRGAPYIAMTDLTRKTPRGFFVDLQHFDLGAEVVPNVALENFAPILMLWDTHDRTSVATHGVIFETRAGQGRLLVSAARHTGEHNAAGRWLLEDLAEHLRSDPPPPQVLSTEIWNYLKAKLQSDQTNLVSRVWKFKPDPNDEGLAQGWNSPNLGSESDWKDIRIGAWWESQGYPELDGLAWYRIWVDVPAAWAGKHIFVSFEGVDDAYDLFVNGAPAGKGGDKANHQDALLEKKSHNITPWVTAGQKALIAVRVDDWHGAGGIFRPVTLGTLPLEPDVDLLK
ncbi:MAG TPA: hypothetical protein VL793_05355, partial [Patescibacteria group bacterium]|nr:hypothetical protein [Patescibacteria group bacterium]